jgi:heme-degrading monooxygenase HmoA
MKPGQAQEAAKRWEAYASSRAKAFPGFKQGYLAANADGAAMVAVTVWDTLPDEATTRQFQEGLREEMAGLMTGPPTTEDFEVLAQI